MGILDIPVTHIIHDIDENGNTFATNTCTWEEVKIDKSLYAEDIITDIGSVVCIHFDGKQPVFIEEDFLPSQSFKISKGAIISDIAFVFQVGEKFVANCRYFGTPNNRDQSNQENQKQSQMLIPVNKRLISKEIREKSGPFVVRIRRTTSKEKTMIESDKGKNNMRNITSSWIVCSFPNEPKPPQARSASSTRIRSSKEFPIAQCNSGVLRRSSDSLSGQNSFPRKRSKSPQDHIVRKKALVPIFLDVEKKDSSWIRDTFLVVKTEQNYDSLRITVWLTFQQIFIEIDTKCRRFPLGSFGNCYRSEKTQLCHIEPMNRPNGILVDIDKDETIKITTDFRIIRTKSGNDIICENVTFGKIVIDRTELNGMDGDWRRYTISPDLRSTKWVLYEEPNAQFDPREIKR